MKLFDYKSFDEQNKVIGEVIDLRLCRKSMIIVIIKQELNLTEHLELK